MQLFFMLSRCGINSDKWSKRRFHQHVTTYIESLPNTQIRDLESWDAYTALIDVADAAAGIAIRKHIDALCKLVTSRCRPFYFRARMLHVASIDELSVFGLTRDETKRFNAAAPKGVKRDISV